MDTKVKLEEKKLQLLVADIKKIQDKLYRVKTPKEMIAVQNELDVLAEKKKDMEEKVFELMMEKEEQEEKIKKKKEEINNQQNLIEEQKKKMDKEISEIKVKINNNIKKRKELAKELPPKIFNLYNQKLMKKNGLALIKIQDDICNACRLDVPRNVMIDVRKYLLTECPNCGRIFLWDGEDD